MKPIAVAGCLVGLSFLEVAVTVLMTKYLGAAQTYALFAVPTVVGLVMQWFRWRRLKANTQDWSKPFSRYNHLQRKERREALESDPEYADSMKTFTEFLLFWISVVLLLVPGFVTDVIGFALMLPVVRRRILEAS